MTDYLVLLEPSSNRVYSGSASQLAAAELEILSAGCLATPLEDIDTEVLGGVPYIRFRSAGDDDQRLLAVVAKLSAAFAVFERCGELLRPVETPSRDRFDDDLLTIPKYSGKTNEQFTQLLLNVTIASTSWAQEFGERSFSVLDPMCGRGTTLDQALTYGFEAAGVEIEEREVDAYATFLSTYLKRKRLKHTFDYSPVRRDGRRVGKRLSVEVNTDAAAFKRGERQTLVVHCADTLASGELFGKRRFDVVVTDAPYGIVHGSREGTGSRDRNPSDLLAAALPGWVRLIRPGGALGMAWNTLGLGRDELVAMMARAGLEPIDTGPYRNFVHRVDASIVRDVVVGRKP